ncbi:MAG: LacI family DNA-binding transcriptional regulator [Pseudomonadota bacterium]
MSSHDVKSVPTLMDVARLAGVSTATVSRCLNDPNRVIASTQEKVMQAVQELGYAPNFSARSLAARRTNTVGAVIPTMDNAIFARGLQAFQEELHQNGITLLVASSQYSPAVEDEQIRTLVARGADALLLIGYHRTPEIYDFLKSRDVPTLVAWVFDPGVGELSIGFDNRGAMRTLAEQVLALGHRRLGFVSADRASNDRARARVDGVQDAMRAQGLDPDTLDVVETTYAIENGAAACATLLGRPDPPSVIMCGNDVLAVGAIRGARRLGLSVPDDVSITGFDDIELAGVADPPLTTVHVPHREMGREAARMLVALLNRETPVTTRELTTRLCLRDTLCAPKNRQ